MKSLLRKDEVAAAVKGGFNSTENKVFDFIHEVDFITLVTSSRNRKDFGISFKRCFYERE